LAGVGVIIQVALLARGLGVSPGSIPASPAGQPRQSANAALHQMTLNAAAREIDALKSAPRPKNAGARRVYSRIGLQRKSRGRKPRIGVGEAKALRYKIAAINAEQAAADKAAGKGNSQINEPSKSRADARQEKERALQQQFDTRSRIRNEVHRAVA
jgi:hypothetical protein